MILDKPHTPPPKRHGSTRTFLKKAAVCWIIILIAFIAVGSLAPLLGSQFGYIQTARLLSGFNGVLFISGVVGVPLIMVLSVGLRAFQKFLDRW